MDYLRTAILVRKKITSGAGYGDWVNFTSAIQLNDVSNIKINKTIAGQQARRDNYSFVVNNTNNTLFENYYSGDGVTKIFTLKWSPVPTEHLSGVYQKLFIQISGVELTYSTDYTISGDTLTFTNAPVLGNRNIRVFYPVIEANDLIRIYRWKNLGSFSTLTDAQKEVAISEGIEGPINEPDLTKQEKNLLTVNGLGLIDTIMSGMAFAQAPTSYLAWDSGTAYIVGNIVSYDSINYISIQNGTNKQPDVETAYWEVVNASPGYPRADLQIQAIIGQINTFNKNRSVYGSNPIEWNMVSDAVTTTLDGGITAGDTTITLTDASQFINPVTEKDTYSEILIDSEIIGYTGKTGNTLTGCTRGLWTTLGGGIAASHLTGVTVYQGNAIGHKPISYSSKYRTAVEMVQELSSDNYTGNGQYLFYVNFNDALPTPGAPSGYKGRYEIIWDKKQTTSSITLSESGDYIEKLDISKTTDDVINCVIYNAGVDLEGSGIEGINYNFSFTSYGLSWQYISSTSDKFQMALTTEQSSNPSKFPRDATTRKFTSGYPLAYPYQFVSCTTCNDLGNETSSVHPSVANAHDYNNVLRYYAKKLAKDFTTTVITLYSRPRFIVKAQYSRSSSQTFALGGLYYINYPTFGLNMLGNGTYPNRLMRLYQIDYNYDNTIITLKEDEITLKGMVGALY